MTSKLSSIIRRWWSGLMPSMEASDAELARTDAEHHPAPGEVVEHDDAVGEDQRVVVGQRVDARAELDVSCCPGRGGDEHFGGRDRLEPGRVVLADPRLVVAELVEVLDQLEVAVQRQRRVLAHRMHGRKEDPEAQGLGACGRPRKGGAVLDVPGWLVPAASRCPLRAGRVRHHDLLGWLAG